MSSCDARRSVVSADLSIYVIHSKPTTINTRLQNVKIQSFYRPQKKKKDKKKSITCSSQTSARSHLSLTIELSVEKKKCEWFRTSSSFEILLEKGEGRGENFDSNPMKLLTLTSSSWLTPPLFFLASGILGLSFKC